MTNRFNQNSHTSRYSSALALLRFYLGAGGRLAQRVFLPLFGSFIIVYAFLGADFFQAFIAALIGGGFLSSAIPTTLFVLILAHIAGRRMVSGMTGWVQHLPVTRNEFRHLAALALFMAILPLLALMAFLSIMASAKYHFNITGYLVGLPLVGMAGALFVLPGRCRWLSRPVLTLSCLCLASQNWLFILIGLILAVAGDLVSGPMVPAARSKGFSSNRLFHLFLVWRAMRLRILIPYFLSFIFYFVLFLFLSNNAVDAYQAGMIIRLMVSGSLAVFCACFVEILVRRRPPWPWIRSLPWSARQRVYREGLILLVHLLPLILGAALIRWQMILFIPCCLPGLVSYSVGAGHQVNSGRFGVFGRILGHTWLPVFLFGLTPWISLVFLFLTPWFMRGAVFLDMSLSVSH